MTASTSAAPSARVVTARRFSPLILRYLAVLCVLLPLPSLVNAYQQYIVNLVFIYVLVAVGFNIVIGYTGQLAFSNVAFFAVGSYTLTILARSGYPLAVGLVAAALVSGLVAVFIGLPALRLKGYYLSIVTIAFVEVVNWVLTNGGDFTGGARGLTLQHGSLFGIALNNPTTHYYVIAPTVVALVMLTNNLLRSGVGRAFVALRENELIAQAMGIEPTRYKLIAFAWSGVLVGIAGGMFALAIGHISPESFGFDEMIRPFIMVVLGGIGTTLGPVVGAVIITLINEGLRSALALQELLYGLLLLIVILVLPNGIIGVASRFFGWRERLYR